MTHSAPNGADQLGGLVDEIPQLIDAAKLRRNKKPGRERPG